MKKLFFWGIVIGVCLLVIGWLAVVLEIGILRTWWDLRNEKSVAGSVYECETGEVISDAKVSVSGVGWGWVGDRLVWDKVFSVSDISDDEGGYLINYFVGNNLGVTKEGYLEAYGFVGDEDFLEVGLIRENDFNKGERTFECKLESECMRQIERDGVITFWDECADSELEK